MAVAEMKLSVDVDEDVKNAQSSVPYVVYMVGLLLIVNVLNFVDRQIVNIIAEPLKHEFQLADWQLGLLTGSAFAIMYAIAAIPIARLSDRLHRPRLLAGTMVIWGGLTALSSAAQSFLHLLLMRLGIGASEAATTPAAHALIADTVSSRWRATALSVFQMGPPLGSLFGLVIGGIIVGAYGWRMALLIVGMPSLVLALLLVLSVREPRLRVAAGVEARTTEPLWEVLRSLLRKPTYNLVVAGVMLTALRTYAIAAFLPSFFFRNHAGELDAFAQALSSYTDLSFSPAGALGLMLGLGGGIAGVIGSFAGGVLADRLISKDVRHYGTAAAIPPAIAIPMLIAGLLWPTMEGALLLLTLPTFFSLMSQGPVYAAIQALAAPRERATAVALAQVVLTLVGLGVGPLLAGIISDILSAHGWTIGEALRWALVILELPALIGCYLLWRCRTTAPRDLGVPLAVLRQEGVHEEGA
jgi:MFS family permease